jgi:hypothetical protein
VACENDSWAVDEDGPDDLASGSDQVDWAGLPINLDLAFSRNQRDKVYAQHLMRRRGAQLRRWLTTGTPMRVRESQADSGHPYRRSTESVSSR